jgi:hypothetical protein
LRWSRHKLQRCRGSGQPARHVRTNAPTPGREWTLVPKTAQGEEMTTKGKYLTVWKQQADGSWKIVRDINNSDEPPK